MKNKICSAFTLGYFLSFMRDKMTDTVLMKKKDKEKFLFLFQHEIESTINSLYKEVFNSDISLISSIRRISIAVFLNDIQENIEKKNHWGDDSFLEFSFLFGCFISVIEGSSFNYIDKAQFEKIIFELLNKIGYYTNYAECKKTVTSIFSEQLDETKYSRRELFHIISNTNENYDIISSIQDFLDNPESINAVGYA